MAGRDGGSALSLRGGARFGSGVSALAHVHLGSSLSVRASSRLGSVLKARGNLYHGGAKFSLQGNMSVSQVEKFGEKMIMTEFVAYASLGDLREAGGLGPRSVFLSTFALCGFANFASIGIQIGGITPLAPERKSELTRLALRAMLGGAFASWVTATIAGMFL